MKTDLELQLDVLAELRWDPSVSTAHIDVQVHDGVVTLAGRVASLTEKWSAGLAVQRVTGVQALADELAVTLPGTRPRSDADIARIAVAALAWTRKLPGVELQVLVEDGWIVLTGTVPSDHQRQAALSAVRHIVGVAGVSEKIELAPLASVAAVKAGIWAEIDTAFKRRALADPAHTDRAALGDPAAPGDRLRRWSDRHPARHATASALNGADSDGARGMPLRARAPVDAG